jgi:DNA-binding LacI/PurR family transcriptional regulator
MIIKGEAHAERRRRRRKVASSGTVDRSEPGVEYAIIDARQGGEQSTEHIIDGDRVVLANRTGFTQDPEIAAAARAQGLKVVPRERAVARFCMTVPELPWKVRKADNADAD